MEEAIKLRDGKAEILRKIQKEDRQHRDTMLEELTEKRAKTWNVTKTQAVQVLMEADKNSGMYKKIGTTIKGINKEGIRSILVPTVENTETKIDCDNDDTNGMWEQIRDPDEIFEMILLQNAKMLTRSRHGLTAKGKFGDELLGRGAENQEFPFSC